MDAHSSEHARGVASYYYGTGSGASSTVGEQFANLVRREVVARTGMLDLGSHAKTWDLLRMTRMPAVRLDCGYLSHPVDRLLLLDARVRSTIAAGGPGRRPAALPARRGRSADGHVRLPCPEGGPRRPPAGTSLRRAAAVTRGARLRRGRSVAVPPGRIPGAPAAGVPTRPAPPRTQQRPVRTPRRPGTAAGPAGRPVRSPHARDEDVGDPGAVLGRQPARGGLAGRWDARRDRAAARRGRAR